MTWPAKAIPRRAGNKYLVLAGTLEIVASKLCYIKKTSFEKNSPYPIHVMDAEFMYTASLPRA
jgi:hypothetical protein